jgi:hypothetical protein
VGCFNFERVKVLIFKLFGRCFEPIGWDGDINSEKSVFADAVSSKPTVWDGDLLIS